MKILLERIELARTQTIQRLQHTRECRRLSAEELSWTKLPLDGECRPVSNFAALDQAQSYISCDWTAMDLAH